MIGILISALVLIVANSRSGYASEQQQIQSHASAPRVISFSGGRVVVERQDDVDHVTVLDIAGTLQSESWCPLESGSYDELSTFFLSPRLRLAIRILWFRWFGIHSV